VLFATTTFPILRYFTTSFLVVACFINSKQG
jgi:hypothetical protein